MRALLGSGANQARAVAWRQHRQHVGDETVLHAPAGALVVADG